MSIDRRDILIDRRAFTGQRCFLGLQVRRAQDAAIGRHEIAGLKLHEVAGHDLGSRNLAQRPVAHDLHVRDLQL